MTTTREVQEYCEALVRFISLMVRSKMSMVGDFRWQEVFDGGGGRREKLWKEDGSCVRCCGIYTRKFRECC